MTSPAGQPPLADQPLPEALARHFVHDVVEETVGRAGRVDGDDVGVAEPGDGARLGQEAADDRGVRGELGMDDLDRDSAVERGVGREKDDPHASASQLPLEPVLRLERALKCGEEIDGRFAHR